MLFYFVCFCHKKSIVLFQVFVRCRHLRSSNLQKIHCFLLSKMFLDRPLSRQPYWLEIPCRSTQLIEFQWPIRLWWCDCFKVFLDAALNSLCVCSPRLKVVDIAPCWKPSNLLYCIFFISSFSYFNILPSQFDINKIYSAEYSNTESIRDLGTLPYCL